MPRIPTPRSPRCLAHHVFMANCDACAEQHSAEAEAARRRLVTERRRIEAGGL